MPWMLHKNILTWLGILARSDKLQGDGTGVSWWYFGLAHIRLYQCHAVNKVGKCSAEYNCKI